MSENASPNCSTVIVSGGSRGLGLAFVQHFLASGRNVASFSRKKTQSIEDLQADERYADRFLFDAMDATDDAAVTTFVQGTYDRFQSIDVLINNAGVATDGVLAITSESAIQQMVTVNLTAAIVLAKECSRFMLLGGGGNIVNISSIIGQRGFSGLATYSATKAGMDGMTRALARELGARSIRVNSVAPGYLDTEMSHGLSDQQKQQIIRRTPLGRLGSCGDVVACVDFLVSPASAFVTGQVLTVDGGATC